MLRFFLASLLFLGVVTSCSPRTQTTSGVAITYAPVLVKLSESAARGGTVTIQGRYLGSAGAGRIWLGADADGKGGYAIPGSAAVSWTDTQIVLTVPQDAPIGGSWLFVEVGGVKSSNGLPFSVKAN